MRYEECTFESSDVLLDEHEFSDCTFVRCNLTYSGGLLPSITDCDFTDCSWQLVGNAENTLTFLKAIYHNFGSWGKNAVEDVFDLIREP